MKKSLFGLLFFLLTISGIAQNSEPVIGIWAGTLEVNGINLRIVFHIANENNVFSAKMDSPDQGVNGIPMDEVSINNTKLVITSAAMRASFEGTFNNTSDSCIGTWSQGGMKFPLNLVKTDKAIIINRPQEPKPPFNYLVEEVTFENKAAGITLSGTITRPDIREPVPGIVLITGSGPQNRDEEIFGHKPFAVIADYLTQNGLAVLRFDDRGVGKSTGDFQKATTADFATDVKAAVEFLKNQEFIVKDRIGLIGHSEGGMIAPMVANNDTDINFVVLMAGPGTPCKDLILYQAEMISLVSKVPDHIIKINKGISEKVYQVVLTEQDNEKALKAIKKIFKKETKKLSEEDRKMLGLDKEAYDVHAKALLTPWFRYFLAFDPSTYLRALTCHVLAINGTYDLQVSAVRDLKGIERSLIEGGNSQYTIKEFTRLNHLFQHTETGLPSEYGTIEETISPEVLEYMKDWIFSVLKK